jgi:hypothetical protein
MRRFLSKLIVILGVGFLFQVIALFVALYFNAKVINSIDFSLDNSIDTVIVGNSMPECAIDDSMLKGVVNWSKSAHRTEVTYFKLRKLIQCNPQIKYAFINFGPRVDDDVEPKKHIVGLCNVLPFMTVSEFLDIPASFQTYISLIADLLQSVVYSSRSLSFTSFGGYISLERNKLEEDIMRRKSAKLVISQSVSKYYDEIVRVCQVHDVQTIFIQTPIYQHDMYYSDESSLFYNHFTNVPFWNFSDIKMPIEFYGDVMHLNRDGAKFFTLLFGQKLDELRFQSGCHQK